MSLLKEELSVPSIQEGAATRDGAANAVAQMIARINTSGRRAKPQPDQCPPLGRSPTGGQNWTPIPRLRSQNRTPKHRTVIGESARRTETAFPWAVER